MGMRASEITTRVGRDLDDEGKLLWRHAILEHIATGLTNARTEGFNNKAKLVKKRAYGYRSFRNYRLRLLNACA